MTHQYDILKKEGRAVVWIEATSDMEKSLLCYSVVHLGTEKDAWHYALRGQARF